jgi:hypothetical protein
VVERDVSNTPRCRTRGILLWGTGALICVGLGLSVWATRLPRAVRCRIAKKSVQGLNSGGAVVWEHPTKLLVSRVNKLSTGEVVFAEAGRGGDGVLWCLSSRGQVLWRRKGRMWVVGVDRGGSILVHGGRPANQFSELYSRRGKPLWKQLGGHIVLSKNNEGFYIVPTSTYAPPAR